ncbi:5-oxoprolinase subunit B family protein [Mycolicibacterium stellerae]|uniref:5-oxoprolinase subunit B family protein n=1 Tax=Mycolicibacterium stellerae TaxID=2358193 RepID=UPI0019D2AB5D|nr:carboxyltransferase domain-containing protein [Mycolicibacterium stellerae]
MTVTTDAMVIGSITDYGDQALLLEFDSTAEVLAWGDILRDADLPGVLDIVPASRTVLLKLDGPRYQGPTRQQLSKLRLAQEAVEQATAPSDGRVDVVIDVVYDGADLDEVGQLTGLSRRDVVAAHTGNPWRVGFAGFAPGFAYLVGGDERLNVPRRSEPRTKVPTGSVGLAGEFSGVYPRESPGGWQLIGHTSKDQADLWDVDREQPALLMPGQWVQFREVSQ